MYVSEMRYADGYWIVSYGPERNPCTHYHRDSNDDAGRKRAERQFRLAIAAIERRKDEDKRLTQRERASLERKRLARMIARAQ